MPVAPSPHNLTAQAGCAARFGAPTHLHEEFCHPHAALGSVGGRREPGGFRCGFVWRRIAPADGLRPRRTDIRFFQRQRPLRRIVPAPLACGKWSSARSISGRTLSGWLPLRLLGPSQGSSSTGLSRICTLGQGIFYADLKSPLRPWLCRRRHRHTRGIRPRAPCRSCTRPCRPAR